MCRREKRWFGRLCIFSLNKLLRSRELPPQDQIPNNFADAVARAFSRSQVLNTLQREFRNIVNQTERRLRNFLHQGKLNAYYFGADACHSVPHAFWATAHADGALVSGTFYSVPRALRAIAHADGAALGRKSRRQS
jgi:hypothetical protein